MIYAFLGLGMVMGWALAMYRVAVVIRDALRDDPPQPVVELSEDLFVATIPQPMRRLIERHVERKHQ